MTAAGRSPVRDMDLLSALRDRLRDRLHGPPPALPALPDRLAERWWGLPPRARLLLTGAVAVAGLAILGATAARSPWGPATTVRLAVRDLPAGHVLTSADLEPRSWPAAVAPADGALVGRRLGTGVPAGTVVTPGHLGAPGIAAHLPPGRVAVPVDGGLLADVTPDLAPGQRLDLLGLRTATDGGVLARDAVVLAVDEVRLWVAVRRAEAGPLAAALAHGTVTVALLPPSSRTTPVGPAPLR